MKMLSETIKIEPVSSAVFDFYFKDLKYGVFDIETTGLSHKYSRLILSGFALPQDDGTLLVKQIFSEGGDEKDVIREKKKKKSELDFIITFNGKSFDVPYLTGRADALNFSSARIPYNLDLFNVVKNFSDIGKFTPNLKQKTLENYLGLWDHRKDEIHGGESIELYADYLQSGDEALEETILLHNSDDVKQLYRLLAILKQTDFHRAMAIGGFSPALFETDKIKLQKNKLTISGIQTDPSNPLLYKGFMDHKGISCDFSHETFTVIINLINHQDVIFADLHKLQLPLEEFKNSGGLSGQFLVLSDRGSVNHLAINTLTKEILGLFEDDFTSEMNFD